MDQQENQSSPGLNNADSGQHKTGQEGQEGQASSGQASYGTNNETGNGSPGGGQMSDASNSGGQSSMQGERNDAGDSMTQQQNQSYGESTSAQRSGGQSIDGEGSTNESFEGSSFGGQSGDETGDQMGGRPGGQQESSFMSQRQDDSSSTYIEKQDQTFDRDGQGAGGTSPSSQPEIDRDVEQSDLDGQ